MKSVDRGVPSHSSFFARYRDQIVAMRNRAGRSFDVIAPVFVTDDRLKELLESGLCVQILTPEDVNIARASYVGQPDPRGEGPAPDRPHAVITFLLA